MKLDIISKENNKLSEINIPDEIAKAENKQLILGYINYVRAMRRSPIASTLDRSEVSGGGKKPWRQKGTGNARHGSRRSPLWVGGGVTFGPDKFRNYHIYLNQKARKAARNAIYKHFLDENSLKIISDITQDIEKTKSAEKLLLDLGLEGKISIILTDSEYAEAKAFRNLPYVKLMSTNCPDIVSLVSSDYLIISKDAFTKEIAKED